MSINDKDIEESITSENNENVEESINPIVTEESNVSDNAVIADVGDETHEKKKKKKIVRRKRKEKVVTNEDDDDTDYVDEDPILPGQIWCCVSVFTPNSVQTPEGEKVITHNVRAFKVRGVFATEKQANERAEEIKKFDTRHNIFTAHVGKWLPWDDDATSAQEAVYAEDKLNGMMKAYNDEQKKSKEYIEQRKMQAASQAKKLKKLKETQDKKKQAQTADPDNLKNDDISKELIEESMKLAQDNIKDILPEAKISDEEIKEQYDSIKNSLDENINTVNENEKEIEQSVDRVSAINDELEKARELLNTMMNDHTKSGKDIMTYQQNR